MTENGEATTALIDKWMSQKWPSAFDAGDYYGSVVIPTLLAEVKRLRELVTETREILRPTTTAAGAYDMVNAARDAIDLYGPSL